jgi:hypothetical protein
MWCNKYFYLHYFLLDCIFSVLIDKTKIGKLRTDWGITCQNNSAQKLVFFWINTLCDHYALIITQVICQIILLFFRFEFAQESKKF